MTGFVKYKLHKLRERFCRWACRRFGHAYTKWELMGLSSKHPGPYYPYCKRCDAIEFKQYDAPKGGDRDA